MTKPNWPDEHVDFLRECWPTYNATAVAHALNTKFETTYTRNAIIGKATRIGLVKRAKTAPKERVRSVVRRSTPFVCRPIAADVPSAVPPPEGGVTLLELDDGMCKWPIGADRYCGGGTDGKRVTYCTDHQKTGTQSLRPVNRIYVKRTYR